MSKKVRFYVGCILLLVEFFAVYLVFRYFFEYAVPLASLVTIGMYYVDARVVKLLNHYSK